MWADMQTLRTKIFYGSTRYFCSACLYTLYGPDEDSLAFLDLRRKLCRLSVETCYDLVVVRTSPVHSGDIAVETGLNTGDLQNWLYLINQKNLPAAASEKFSGDGVYWSGNDNEEFDNHYRATHPEDKYTRGPEILMEAKSKPSPGGPRKQADKTAKKEVTTPRKTNAAPIAPPRRSNPTPAAPPPEAAPPIAVPAAEQPAMDNAQMQNHELPTEVAKAEEAKQDCRDCLMPFLIGGAVVAAAAILVGAFLVARRN